MDIKVIVLDTQVYSNTGGQSSTASFKGQDAKMSAHGTVIFGKKENRKEIANICMMHKDVYVAQTTCAHPNHFYKAIMEANQYPGPAIVNVFTTCQPEHGVADNMAEHQAKLAADSRSFPVFIYDPRKGSRFSIAHVIDVVKERVHSNSPLSAHPHGVDMCSTSQGRMGDRGKEREGHHSWLHHAHGNTKEKPAFSWDVLGREEEHKEFGDGWQEFRKGAMPLSLLTRVYHVLLPHKLT